MAETCIDADYETGFICGVDGITYEHLCDLKCNEAYPPGNEDCVSLEQCPDIAHMGPCKVPGYCLGTGCPADYNPICTTEGATYWNYCCFMMAMEGLVSDEEDLWDLVEQMYFCQGECVDELICPDAPMACDPVCGFDKWGQQTSFINGQVIECLGGTRLGL